MKYFLRGLIHIGMILLISPILMPLFFIETMFELVQDIGGADTTDNFRIWIKIMDFVESISSYFIRYE